MAATQPESVRSNLDGHVGLVELARPPHNFLDADFIGGIASALESLAGTGDCRAIVVAADGRSFCAGANFGASPGAPLPSSDSSPGAIFRETVFRFYAEAERIFALPTPMVAAVHGPAVGAGLGLALACDLRVSCQEAFFAGNFVRLGIHPGFALTVTLPDLIGPGRAADLLLTGRRVSGDEALEIGLVERCVPGSQVRETAIALASEIAEAAPLAVGATRATLRRGLLERARAAMKAELEEQARLMETADAAEGISAMLARRAPRFDGK